MTRVALTLVLVAVVLFRDLPLPAMLVALLALQTYDLYSTHQAMLRGAKA